MDNSVFNLIPPLRSVLPNPSCPSFLKHVFTAYRILHYLVSSHHWPFIRSFVFLSSAQPQSLLSLVLISFSSACPEIYGFKYQLLVDHSKIFISDKLLHEIHLCMCYIHLIFNRYLTLSMCQTGFLVSRPLPQLTSSSSEPFTISADTTL